ncbi:MAG: hypothetical protein ACRCWP_14205 [Shewanella sp.]
MAYINKLIDLTVSHIFSGPTSHHLAGDLPIDDVSSQQQPSSFAHQI